MMGKFNKAFWCYVVALVLVVMFLVALENKDTSTSEIKSEYNYKDTNENKSESSNISEEELEDDINKDLKANLLGNSKVEKELFNSRCLPYIMWVSDNVIDKVKVREVTIINTDPLPNGGYVVGDDLMLIETYSDTGVTSQKIMYADSIILTNQELDSSYDAIPLMVRALTLGNLDSSFNRMLKVYTNDVKIDTYSKYLGSSSNSQMGGKQAYEIYLEDGVLITLPTDELIGYKKPMLSGTLGYIIKE